MKKKNNLRSFLLTTLILFLFIVAVSGCGTKEQTSDSSVASTDDKTSIDIIDTSDISQEAPGSSDIQSQLQIIEKNVANCIESHGDYLAFFPRFCITDLNHNNRLELIISSIQGSGCYSFSAVYEVNETFNGLEMLSADDKLDDAGDFLSYDSLVCYEKNGVSYYLIEDYCSGGWDSKLNSFYMYCFDDIVTKDIICSYYITADMTADYECIYYVNLYDSTSKVITEEEYFSLIDSYLDSYTKQPSCKINWVRYSEDSDIAELVSESYYGYNPNSDNTDIDFGYTKIHEETGEYIIVTEEQ